MNSGILPLTFVEEKDYDRIEQGDEIRFTNLKEQVKRGGEIQAEIVGKGTVALHLDASERYREILLAGGLLNQVGAKAE